MVRAVDSETVVVSSSKRNAARPQSRTHTTLLLLLQAAVEDEAEDVEPHAAHLAAAVVERAEVLEVDPT